MFSIFNFHSFVQSFSNFYYFYYYQFKMKKQWSLKENLNKFTSYDSHCGNRTCKRTNVLCQIQMITSLYVNVLTHVQICFIKNIIISFFYRAFI